MADRQRRVVWAAAALAALDETAEYVTEDSEVAAAHIVTTAVDVAAGLSQFAMRGRVVPEFGDSSIREVFVFRYRMLYRVETDLVTIIGFVHGARDFERWSRDPEN